jgi:nucleoside-diphosphate-sugar epimerase
VKTVVTASSRRKHEHFMSDNFWSSKRVLVTGGAGFLGSHVVNRLRAEAGCAVAIVRSREYNLTRLE